MAETYSEQGIERPADGEEGWLTDRRVRWLGIVIAGAFTLGVLFGCLGFCYQATLAVFSSRARRVITERKAVRDLLRYASASVLVGFGVKLLLEKRVAH